MGNYAGRIRDALATNGFLVAVALLSFVVTVSRGGDQTLMIVLRETMAGHFGFLTCLCLGIFVAFLRVDRSIQTLPVLAGVAGESLLVIFFRAPYGLGLGLGSLAGGGISMMTSTKQAAVHSSVVYSGTSLLLLTAVAPVWLHEAALQTSVVYDRFLWATECRLPVAPTLLLQTLYDRSMVQPAAHLAYGSLMGFVFLAVGEEIRDNPDRIPPTVMTSLLVFLLGFCGYRLCPAIGPAQTMMLHDQNFFESCSQARLFSIGQPVPRNAMPSLHTAWAMIAWLSNPKSNFIRAVLFLQFVLVLFATVGLREHYMVDIVVAGPMTLFCLSAVKARVQQEKICWLTAAFVFLCISIVWIRNLGSSLYLILFWCFQIIMFVGAIYTWRRTTAAAVG